MATSTVKTGYRVEISSTNEGGTGIVFTTEDDGWTDDFSASLWAAVEGLAWPPGCGITITKTAITTEVFTTNTSGTSLTFS